MGLLDNFSYHILSAKYCLEGICWKNFNHLIWVIGLFLGHLSHSGDYHYGLASVVVRHALTSSSQELLGLS